MAKKDPPKPIMPLKHHFYASLDNFIQASLMLYQGLDMIKEDLPPGLRTVMQKHLDNWQAAWSSDDESEY